MWILLSAGLLVVMLTSATSQIEAQRVILEGVGRYRICDPAFEGIRVILSYRGEEYSPAYVCGISGVAFRISGPCFCASTSFGQAMSDAGLARLFGYECESVFWLQSEKPEEHMQQILTRAKQEIRSGRPVLMFDVFTDRESDVVCGFDDEKNELYGRGSYAGLEEYAHAKQTRPLEGEGTPMLGALFIGEKTGEFDARTAEIAALKEAVAHAHGASSRVLAGDMVHYGAGLECYDRMIAGHRFFPEARVARPDINAKTLSILRSTRRAASEFMLELASKYPEVSARLKMAAEHFARESDALDSCLKLFPNRTEEELDDLDNQICAAAYLRQARAMYSLAIDEIARALPKLTR